MARTSKTSKKTTKPNKNVRDSVLKTEIGKSSYKKLSISTIFFIISLLGVAIMMTICCNYFIKGGDWNDLRIIFNIFPIFSITSIVTAATSCFFLGEFNGIIKSHRK